MANINPNPATKKVAFEGTLDMPVDAKDTDKGVEKNIPPAFELTHSAPTEKVEAPDATKTVSTEDVPIPVKKEEKHLLSDGKKQAVHDDRHPVAPENEWGSRMSAKRVRLADGEIMRK